MDRIVVVPYNENWEKEFTIAKNFYSKLLKDTNVEIVHVGSTSIEGLPAKPILDIDIIVNNKKDSNHVIKLLSTVGYNHRGNLGIEGREAFSYKKDNENITWMDHHLYVCMRGSENLLNHLYLKKHLLSNEKDIREYSLLKQELAKKYPYDIDKYVEGKTKLITRFLKEEGMDLIALEKITNINKAK